MLKWIKKVLHYHKPIVFLVKCLKVVSNCFLKFIYFHGDLYCCVKYYIVEYEDEIFKTYHKSNAQKKMARFGFGCKFYDLNFELSSSS